MQKIENLYETSYNILEEEYNDGERTLSRISKIDNRGTSRTSNTASDQIKLPSWNRFNQKELQTLGQRGDKKRSLQISSSWRQNERTQFANVSQRLNSNQNINSDSDVNIQFLESNKANKVKENANRQLWQKVLNLKDAKNTTIP